MNYESRKALTAIVLSVLRLVIGGWIVMVSFEMLNNDAPAIPAFGFWASAGILLVVSCAASVAAAAWKESS